MTPDTTAAVARESATKAHTALIEARQIVAPDGLLLQDGSVRVTDPRGRTVTLPEHVLRHAEERLANRAADGATPERLRAEAAAWMGSEIAKSSHGHVSPTDGALDALRRLSEHSPDNAVVATALGREVAGERGVEQVRGESATGRPSQADAALRPGLHYDGASDIVERARSLTTDPSKPWFPEATGLTGRPPHLDELTLDEVRSALDDLRPSDLGRGVKGWTWSEDNSVLNVETESWGVRQIRPVIETTPGSLSAMEPGRNGEPDQLKIAPWVMSKEAAEAAGLSPEAVARDVQVLPRAWLHGITDMMQRTAASEARSGQGMIRRFVSDIRSMVRNEGPVNQLINDHRYLSREWRAATDATGRSRLAEQIKEVGQELRMLGRTPPEPPWVRGADGGVQPVHTPHSELTAKVREVAESLRRDVDNLTGSLTTHWDRAMQADASARVAQHDAEKAAGQQDFGAHERERQALNRVAEKKLEAAGHREMAERYQNVLNQAVKARTSYSALESSLDRMVTEPQSDLMARVSADANVLLAEAGRRELHEYGDSLKELLPPDLVGPEAVLTGELPLRNSVTETGNVLLADLGIDHTFTVESMERGLRAAFGKLVSRDGALLPVGPDGALLRVRMRTRDLVEVLNPRLRSGETITGGFSEGGQWTGATANHSRTTGYEVDLAALAQHLPGDHPTVATVRAVMKMFGPSLEVDRGTGWSESANDLYDARPGAVVNIKGGKVIVVDALAEVELSVVLPNGYETPVTHVTTGTHEDASNVQVMVSNASVMKPPAETVQLPVYERQKVPLPDHKVVELNGLEEFLHKSVKSLEDQNIPVDTETRAQLRHLLVDVPGENLKAMARDQGMVRPVPGTDLVVRLRARFDLSNVELKQTSAVDLMESVDVGFIGTTGGDAYNVSRNVSTTVPINPWSGAADIVPGHREFKVGLSGRLNGGRSVTHTDTVTVGGVTIPVTVARHVGHTVVEKFPEGAVKIEARFYSAKDNRALDPVTHELSGSIRFPESDAHEYGFPVDAAAYKRNDTNAVLRNPDGSPVLRDDPNPVAPKGRVAAPPPHIGEGEGQMRGAGHALVSKVTGVEEGLPEIVDKLEDLGVLSKLDEHGLPTSSSKHPDVAEVLGQTVAQRKLEELGDRVRTHFDEAAQSGVVTRLTHVRPHGAPEHYTLTTRTRQKFGEHHFGGTNTSKQAIKLDIGSQSDGTTSTRSVTYTGGGGASVGHKPAGHSGAEEGLGADAGKNRGHSESVTKSSMVNDVSLTESGVEMADFATEVEVIHTLTDAKGNVLAETRHDGHAEISWPVDMLQETEPRSGPVAASASPEAPRPTSGKVLEKSTPQHMDAPGLRKAVEDKLFKGRELPAGVATFLDNRNLVTYMDEWLGHGYQTPVTIDPHGVQPRRLTLEVHGSVGPSEFVGPLDAVDGKINLTADSTTTTSSHSSGSKVSGSASGSAHHGDGLTDGGGGDVYKTRNKSGSHSQTETWGFEQLKIGIDPKLKYTAVARLEVSLSDPVTGKSEKMFVDAPMMYTVPESAALDLHAQGEMSLPTHHMADVMQRFLDGNLLSDERTAARLAAPYLAELAELGRNGDPLPALSAGHTPEAFVDKVLSLADAGKALSHGAAEEHAGKDLLSAHDLAASGLEVVIPEPFEHGMASSLFDEVELFSADGTRTSVHSGVVRAVTERSPEAWTSDPTLRQRLSGKFDGTRWEGFIKEMVDPWGFDRDLRVRTDDAGGNALLNVQVQVTFGDRTVMIGNTKHVVPIFQSYTWKGFNIFRSHGGSVGGDISAGHGSGEGGSTASAGIAQSWSLGGGRGRMLTKMRRVRWYDAAGTDPAQRGSARVEQPIKVTITVDQVPLAPGETKVKGPGDGRGPVTIELEGRTVRYIPARMVEPAEGHPAVLENPRATPEHPRDMRPVKLSGSDFFVDGVEGNEAYKVMHDTFTDLLGKDAEREIRRELARQWSGLARESPLNFERMTNGEGYEIRVAAGKGVATARVHLDMHGLRPGKAGGAEVSQIDRAEDVTAMSVSTGHKLPVSRSLEVKDSNVGVGIKESSGAQASESVSDNNGVRHEISDYSESDRSVTTGTDATYTIDFTKGGEAIQRTAPGQVHLTLAGPEHDAVHARQEAGRRHDSSWGLGSGRKRRGILSAKHGWDVVEIGREEQPSAPLTRALMDARLNDTEVRIEVRPKDGGVTHRYRALPDGTLHNGDDWTDGGYSAAFTGLPPSLVPLAEANHVNLREVFERGPGPEGFADRVRAELIARKVPLSPKDNPPSVLSPEEGNESPDGSWHGGLPGDGASAGGGFGGGA